MSAFLFCLTAFLYFFLVGLACISSLRPRGNYWQTYLLAPSAGLAATVLPTFALSRAGLAVGEFGVALSGGLFAVALLFLIIRRPIASWSRIRTFSSLCFISALLIGWPMFVYGFDWLSFANDDMANYSLAAGRFLHGGFFAPIDIESFKAGRNYEDAYWFMHVAGASRSGSELVLALAAATTGLNPHQVFMPVIIALFICLVCATAALASGIQSGWKVPLLAGGLFAISPMSSLGTLYQLIGQVGGLSLLVGASAIMLPNSITDRRSLVVTAVLAALFSSALVVWYPEVLPFLALAWVVSVFLQRRSTITKSVWFASITLVMISIALNQYLLQALKFLLFQVRYGVAHADVSTALFPFFLMPSGLAAFWGLIPIATHIPEPGLSLSIALGIALFAFLAYALVKVGRTEPAASMLVVMVIVGGMLFVRNNDFGLYKLVMFSQPFVAVVCARYLFHCRHAFGALKVKLAGAMVLMLLFATQWGYVSRSTGEALGGLNEIPGASHEKINRQFSALVDPLRNKPDVVLISDASNVVLAKLQALYLRGISAYFPSKNFFIGGIAAIPLTPEEQRIRSAANQFSSALLNGNSFERLQGLSDGQRVYVTTAAKNDIFNWYGRPEKRSSYFELLTEPRNRLQFVHSELGHHYYLGNRRLISFYQLENDPMFPGQQMSSLGRHFLFNVINPQGSPRLVAELSSTVLKQFLSELPRPIVQSQILGFVGRGSGRIFSQPITFSKIGEDSYLSIDMGREGLVNERRDLGLMMLYGRDVPLDPRRIATFGRDISLISSEEYAQLKPPQSLSKFPEELANKALEYSGIYEDGWISEHAFFMLAAPGGQAQVVVEGSVPRIEGDHFSAEIALSVDGTVVARRVIRPGPFKIEASATTAVGRSRLEVKFSKAQVLPGSDGRPVGAKIDVIGFR